MRRLSLLPALAVLTIGLVAAPSIARADDGQPTTQPSVVTSTDSNGLQFTGNGEHTIDNMVLGSDAGAIVKAHNDGSKSITSTSDFGGALVGGLTDQQKQAQADMEARRQTAIAAAEQAERERLATLIESRRQRAQERARNTVDRVVSQKTYTTNNANVTVTVVKREQKKAEPVTTPVEKKAPVATVTDTAKNTQVANKTDNQSQAKADASSQPKVRSKRDLTETPSANNQNNNKEVAKTDSQASKVDTSSRTEATIEESKPVAEVKELTGNEKLDTAVAKHLDAIVKTVKMDNLDNMDSKKLDKTIKSLDKLYKSAKDDLSKKDEANLKKLISALKKLQKADNKTDSAKLVKSIAKLTKKLK